jgi:AraC family transcriptional regulator
MDNLDVQRGSLDYMAGVSVSKLEHLPDGMVSWKVPSNTYAVFETTLASIGDVFSHIYGSWLPTSGYEQLAVPYFERYGESFNPGDPSSTLEIYIPVRKLGG